MYASDKDLEEIVRLASNFMAWEDGELADPTEYDIVCNIIGERLSITLKQGSVIVKSVNIYIEQVDQTYGEFIYVELFGTGRGILLTDIDEIRFSADSLSSSYEYGDWAPGTDSSIEVIGLEFEEDRTPYRAEIGSQV